MIPREVVERVREAADLPALFEAITTVRRRGGGFMASCPFHAERTPSCSIFRRDGAWRFRCHGCGAAGDAFAFLQQTQGLSFVDAVRVVADGAGIALPDAPTNRAARRRLHKEEAKRQSETAMLRDLDQRLASMATTAAIRAHDADQHALYWERLWKRARERLGENHYLTNIAADFLAKAYDVLAIADARFEELNEVASARTPRSAKARWFVEWAKECGDEHKQAG